MVPVCEKAVLRPVGDFVAGKKHRNAVDGYEKNRHRVRGLIGHLRLRPSVVGGEVVVVVVVHHARAFRIARLVFRKPLFEIAGGLELSILGAREEILHIYSDSKTVVGVVRFELAYGAGGLGYQGDVGLYLFEPRARAFPKFNGDVALRVRAVAVNAKFADKIFHV